MTRLSQKSKYKTLRRISLSIAVLLSLSACESALFLGQGGSIAHQAVYGEPVNVKTKSYAAADYLDQALRINARTNDLIRVEPLFTPPNEYSLKINNLATAVPYQVGERLAQLGYNTDLSQVSDIPTSGNKNADFDTPQFILGGTFYPQARFFDFYREVKINMSVVEVRSKRILSSFSYVLPAKAKTNDMSTKNLPKTKEEAKEYNKQFSPIRSVMEALESINPNDDNADIKAPSGNNGQQQNGAQSSSNILSRTLNDISAKPDYERKPLNN